MTGKCIEGNFEERRKNILEKERCIGDVIGIQRKNKLERKVYKEKVKVYKRDGVLLEWEKNYIAHSREKSGRKNGRVYEN